MFSLCDGLIAHKNVATTIHQGLLIDSLKSIFSNHELHQNARKETQFKYDTTTGGVLELDIWIPALHLCFEFQDTYHYIPTWYNQSSRDFILQQDNIKKSLVHRSNITLVEVPCWWDGQINSLVSTIRFQRPDLLQDYYYTDANNGDEENTVSPIPLNSYFGFFPHAIPDIGELMLASFPVDPKFKSTMVSNTWWVGEKYDGVRVCWHPTQKILYGRSGREFSLMHQITTHHLPDIFIDAELWFGRGRFSHIYMLVNGAPEQVYWHLLRLISFDVPSVDQRKIPFEKRYEYLLSQITRDSPFINVAPRVLYKNGLQLKKIVESVIDNGGEGIILRQCKSPYEPGRTSMLIKLKTSYGDCEAIVAGVSQNKAVKIGLPDGKYVVVQPYNVNIPTPKVGTVVTITYEKHYLRDIPLNPKIYRVRHDLSWQDVLLNSHKDKKYLSGSSYAASFSVHPLDKQMTSRMRTYLENYARSKNMNPLVSETWYNLSYEALNQFQHGRATLQRFNGSYYKVIRYLFPEVPLDHKAFPEVENRRMFFEKYAAKHGFDARNADNWYKQSRKKIMACEGAGRVLFFHDRSVSKALMDLFPDIGLVRSKFPSLPMWRNPKNRRRFFEDYAKEHKFDPLVPNHWYAQSKKLIEEKKGAQRVLFYHDFNVSKALLELFPDIGFIESKFSKPPRWCDEENRRSFFIAYAKENGFDPLIAENWYSQSKEKIMSLKGAAGVVIYHNYSVANALVELFPNIGLAKDKLEQQWDAKYRRIRERQDFFEQYAREHGFDPLVPDNWYSLTKKQFSLLKREKKMTYHKILFAYDHDLSKALIDLFPNIGLNKSKFQLY